MALIAFETSCDETSVAIVQDGTILSTAVSSQIQLHAEYGGVVPELAAREHLRNLMPVAEMALRDAGLDAEAVTACAATQGPGLPAALMVGLKAAQAFAFSRNLPFIGIHHHEAHLYSPWIDRVGNVLRCRPIEPNLSLIVSGGHTMLVQVLDDLRHKVLGTTLDDAAGECFDKTGKLLGLPYPAGPGMDELARLGDPKAVAFPRPLINDSNDDFSFSGLKTSVRYHLRDRPDAIKDVAALQNLCASIEAAIVEVLVAKTIRAAVRLGVGWVTASGGVTCNSSLRLKLSEACKRAGLKLKLAEKALCTDNAGMIGVLAERRLEKSATSPIFEEDILPGWRLDDLANAGTSRVQ